jgi:hypothetical protein
MWLVSVEPSDRPNLLPNQHPTYQHQANSAYEQKTKVQLIDFLHRACFSPPISTWTQAIEKNFFATWPGLTANTIRKYLPKSLATVKGYLKAAPKNLRSTSKTRPTLAPTDANTAMTTPTSSHVQTHLVYTKVILITGQIHFNKTGRFPVTSSRGNQYIMIVYLMRPSRTNPRLSGEAQLNGAFDYNKTPLAPPGTKVLIHETPNRRQI